MNDRGMFERRLMVVVGLLAIVFTVILARLFQLQVVAADYYVQRAEQAVILSPTPLPFVRGRILDRHGETLVEDKATWDVSIDFEILAATVGETAQAQEARRQLVRRWRRYFRNAGVSDVEQALDQKIRAMWGDLALFFRITGREPVNIKERGREVYDKVMRVRQAVSARRGFEAPVAEEKLAHAIIEDVNPEQQIAARELLTRYPWVHVEPSSARRFNDDATALAHVIGRLGRVDAETVAGDPEADNPFARYQANDVLGTTGVEWLAERRLRGRRGQLTMDRDGHVLEEIEAENGDDVTLTIDAGLQSRLYELLGQTVRENKNSSGGAIIVLDVESREVLALVSYPAYDPNAFDKLYSGLREDVDHMPLLFRAVATRYAPGSTIKPLTCLAGMINGAIGVDSREVCTGYLHEDVRDAWRCWQIHGTDLRKAHGSIDVVGALTGSCNVFMYRLGDRLGVDRLCSAFDMVGIGRTTGVGLREEVTGINPTPSWLMSELSRSVVPGMARNYSIGQGEIAATPLQVANLMATYASGRWKPVRLLDPLGSDQGVEGARDQGIEGPRNRGIAESSDRGMAGPRDEGSEAADDSSFSPSPLRGEGGVRVDGLPSRARRTREQHSDPEWRLPGTSEQWLAIRRGICGVTNDPDGTAYKYAHFEQDGWTLCGKTGSATAHPWPTSYRVPYTDAAGHKSYAIVREGAADLAIARFQAENPDATVDSSRVEVASRWPPHPPEDGENHSHAWFGAYLQPLGTNGHPDYSRSPKFAFAVLVEFGGSGGQVSGPLAKQVAAELLGHPSGLADQ